MTTEEMKIGMVLIRSDLRIGYEPFFQELIAGIEGASARHHATLVTHVVSDIDAEVATYKRWTNQCTVDVVLLVDVRASDPRVPLLEDLNLPTVVVAHPGLAGRFPAVWTDDVQVMAEAVRFLSSSGHLNIGHVTGPTNLGHTQLREAAFGEEVRRLGGTPLIVHGDYTEASGAEATKALLEGVPRPTAIIYDNDIMALGGLREAVAHNVVVPDDLSLLAWDDSKLCELAAPAVGALSHDIQGIGELCFEVAHVLVSTGAAANRRADEVRLLVRETVTARAGEHDR